MKPSVTYVLQKTKHLLSSKIDGKRIGSFSIRLIIHVLESMKTETGSVVKLTAKQLSKASPNDAKELVSINVCGIEFTQQHNFRSEKNASYVFKCDDYICNVLIPLSFEKRGDVEIDALIKATWEHYQVVIGRDKNIYPKGVTLTRSSDGRYACLKTVFKNNPHFSLDDAKSVIDGTVTSLFHMGFDVTTGDRQKKYCDIKNIFTNQQRIESMIAKSGDEHYSIQLNKIQQRAGKKNFIDALKADLETSETTDVDADLWLEI